MFKNIVYKIISCYRPIRLNDLGGHPPKEISKVYRVFECLLHIVEMAASVQVFSQASKDSLMIVVQLKESGR